MIVFAKREKFYPATPNTWCPTFVMSPAKELAALSAWATCPNGHNASLADHEIAPDGAVHPSVECQLDGCGFHEYVKLDRWGK